MACLVPGLTLLCHLVHNTMQSMSILDIIFSSTVDHIEWNILPSKNGRILCWCSTEVAAHLPIITGLKKVEFEFASRAAVASAQSSAGSPWRADWCDSLGVQHPPHCTYSRKQIPAVQTPTAEEKSISGLPTSLSRIQGCWRGYLTIYHNLSLLFRSKKTAPLRWENLHHQVLATLQHLCN